MILISWLFYQNISWVAQRTLFEFIGIHWLKHFSMLISTFLARTLIPILFTTVSWLLPLSLAQTTCSVNIDWIHVEWMNSSSHHLKFDYKHKSNQDAVNIAKLYQMTVLVFIIAHVYIFWITILCSFLSIGTYFYPKDFCWSLCPWLSLC